MKKRINKRIGAVIVFCISVAAFLLLTIPIRMRLDIADITEIRPNAAIAPVMGLIFGLPAALGCGVGNFIADMISGYGITYGLLSFVQQIVYGMVSRFLWKKVNKEHDGNEFRLDSIGRFWKFCMVMLVDALLLVLFAGLVNHAYSVTALFSTENLYLFVNCFDSGILFGCPLLILGHFLQRYLDRLQSGSEDKIFTFSLNERMILNTIITGLGICVLVGLSVYLTDRFGTNDTVGDMWGRIYLFETLTMNIYFLLSMGMMWFTEKKVTRPIEGLAKIARNYYAEESTEEKRRALTEACREYANANTEAGNLARSYLAMADDIDTYINHLKTVTAEKERINTELSLASNIQTNMLPCIFPFFPEHQEVDVYATMTPAKEVGGDFYDLFMVDDDHAAFVIADVSGKGVPAALFMVITKTLIKNYAQLGMSPDEVFTVTNRRLCEGNDEDLFVTAWMGIFEISSGRLSYVNAGHNPPMICRNGEFRYLKAPAGLVLAGMEDFTYQKNEIQLYPHERLFLYTDGVTEATSLEKELYGKERMEQFLNRHAKDSAKDVLHQLKADIDQFVGDVPQYDDITMLMFDYNEKAGREK